LAAIGRPEKIRWRGAAAIRAPAPPALACGFDNPSANGRRIAAVGGTPRPPDLPLSSGGELNAFTAPHPLSRP